ncbi:MAG: epoxyqueuosine reductase [Defluviitaleaceae bacterium]|nr:epoxyqueuosine reductase [Defluviitaleaceae bacterium]
MSVTGKEIHDKAMALGYSACGIVRAEAMRGYADMIGRRNARFPAVKPYNSYFAGFAKPEEAEPWAKSIIVCAGRYGRYKIPPELQGRIGKYYLTDYRAAPESKESKAAALFDGFFTERGVKFKKNTWAGGITACRYAAVKAGIGIIRKNNFLYTEDGSWVWLETWLIDQDLEYICENSLTPCPEDCAACMDACAAGALAEPYQMNAFACTTMLTWGGLPNTLPPEDTRPKMKGWVYGCDDCQDCCPMNAGRWEDEDEFPGLEKLRQYLTLERLCGMDDETVEAELMPKFVYINREKIWKWRANALRAMAYEYKPEYLPYMRRALEDENELVREMARWALEQTPPES